MLRIVAVLLFALGCSKAKEKEASPPPPPPPAADAMSVAVDAMPAGETASDAATEGSAGSAGSAADTGSAGDAVVAVVEFDKLSHDDKVKFMKQKVMPKMKPILQKFDPKEFPNVTCKTCHGKDPKKSKYEMPSPDLPALDFDAIKAGKEDPKMVEFMSKVVKPEMAKLLGEPEMSDTNPDGFGCLDCHTMKKKK